METRRLADENAAIVRRGYEAFNTADMETLTELFDESASWHTPGRSRIAGDHKGRVGCGFGKAKEVSEAIRKASDSARKAMKNFSLAQNTIPHEVTGEFGGGRVLLRPASPGTGIIAGGGVRAVCEAVGIRDVLAKSLGSNNHANVVKATLEALSKLRPREEIFRVRGIKTKPTKAEAALEVATA